MSRSAASVPRSGQGEAFEQQTGGEALPSGAQRHAGEQIAPASMGFGQREVADVQRADQQDGDGPAPEQIDHAAEVADEERRERLDGGVKSRPLEQSGQVRLAFEERDVDGVDFPLDLIDCHARCHPSHVIPVVGHRVPDVVGKHERDPVTHFGIEEREARGHHAHDGVGASGDPDRGSDHHRVRAEAIAPEPVAQDDPVLVADLAFLARERPTQSGADGEGGEE